MVAHRQDSDNGEMTYQATIIINQQSSIKVNGIKFFFKTLTLLADKIKTIFIRLKTRFKIVGSKHGSWTN